MSNDLLGIKPFAEAVNAATKAAIEGASAFLGRICLPAAEEFGMLIKDKISFWRLKNLLKVSEKAENIINKIPDFKSRHAHPRLVFSILDNASWSEDDTIQNMWAGLLASSCSSSGKDDSNLIFINILSQLTKSQAIIVNYCCEASIKFIGTHGLIQSNELLTEISNLIEIFGISDLHIIDRELDHLRALGLINKGILLDINYAEISPTPLALYMYVRCQGSEDSPANYFGF